MNHKLVAVQDLKAQAFLNIATVRTAAEGIRQFESVCKNSNSQFAQFPSDFVLYELAEYDELTGTITPHSKPRALATAAEFANKNFPVSNPLLQNSTNPNLQNN